MIASQNSQRLVSRTVGTGNDLVLLHGWGMNSGAFSSFIPFLSSHFRVTTIDLPGFGENATVLPARYDLASLTAMIAAHLPAHAIIAGWSLGGLVAQSLALEETELRGVVTLASSPKFVAGPGWPGIDPALLDEFKSQLKDDYQKTIDRFLAIQAMGSDSARHDIKRIRQQITDYPAPAEAALHGGLGILGDADMRERIGRIQRPSLRIYGRRDTLVPSSGIDRICELHPQSDTVVLPHASHAPFMSHPQQTANIILNFAASLDQKTLA
ncbi:pimeloyl-ACP methyl ester esterase BioH [Alteromonas halophila]|uniref:pimeloyl-ACP methyl ester esterase BioH n=1 Tax=Alteromonas halophila TaxID=516698 RepID=UPI001E493D2C|nr:pimeloyl-ACP methyl ester esterase BioH [Alteromonas halophila]